MKKGGTMRFGVQTRTTCWRGECADNPELRGESVAVCGVHR